MVAKRWITGIGMGTAAVAAAFVAPALQAQNGAELRTATRGSRLDLAAIGSFTPAAADPKLAAILARSGLSGGSFRFTPSEPRLGNRNVTVAVRARGTVRVSSASAAAVAPPAVAMAPIGYTLGTSVGWKKFAVAGDLGVLAPSIGRETFDLASNYASKSATRSKSAGDRPLIGNTPRIVENPSYAADMSSSFSLSRNLDVTTGVRYKSEEAQRLPRLADNRRDSQTVYVGTAFRF